ncbi:RNA-binding protein 24-A-like [Pyrus ussuriensis x Pyrus communis]|uniref:RNA-binding protein 24-A-like n=1 Tax=Pyrus ussuriensis x Pyrus communis TaxID=2448454 RepID=A0A5N5HVM1_9ROSA|nr:RNA-binding protein 24-A-like [Pyrus ussuriensis x Pyrus communis]
MAYQSSGSSSSPSGFQFPNSSSPFGDTTYTKVFVGGLAWETHSDTMRRHFDQFGQILEAVVIIDKNSGRSKGYGFVTFREPEAAARACADPTPIIDGRRANCNLASLRQSRPPLPYGIVSYALGLITNNLVPLCSFQFHAQLQLVHCFLVMFVFVLSISFIRFQRFIDFVLNTAIIYMDLKKKKELRSSLVSITFSC